MESTQAELLPSPAEKKASKAAPVTCWARSRTGTRCQCLPNHPGEHDDGLTTWAQLPGGTVEKPTAAPPIPPLPVRADALEAEVFSLREALAHVADKLEAVRRELRDMDAKRLPQKAQARLVQLQEVLFGAWQVAARGRVPELEEGDAPPHEDAATEIDDADTFPPLRYCGAPHPSLEGVGCGLSAGHTSWHHSGTAGEGQSWRQEGAADDAAERCATCGTPWKEKHGGCSDCFSDARKAQPRGKKAKASAAAPPPDVGDTRCGAVHHGHRCELERGHPEAHHAPGGAIKNGWTGWWPRVDGAVDTCMPGGPDAAERKGAAGGDDVDRRERKVMERDARMTVIELGEAFDAKHPLLTPGGWCVGEVTTFANGHQAVSVEEAGGATVALLEVEEVEDRAGMMAEAQLMAASKDLAAVLAAQTALLEQLMRRGYLEAAQVPNGAPLVAAARHLLANALGPAAGGS